MFVDSHCHLSSPELIARLPEIRAAMRAAHVDKALCICTTLDEFERVHALALGDDDLWCSVGVHPDEEDSREPTVEGLVALAALPKVVAIGETGLDYYYNHSPKEAQREAFPRFVELARSVGKPVVCHIRDAHDDARAILRETRAAELGCIIHCFTGTPDDARAYAEMDCYVSFSGIVTYKTAQPLRDSVPLIPRERLLIETDCPYLAPVPVRGKRNEPGNLVHTAEVVARCSGTSFEELARITTENACRIYRLTATG
jgi:TatD DNase family protein